MGQRGLAMRRTCPIFPRLLLPLLGLSCATLPFERDWIRIESAHFELVSSAGEERSLELARDLELLRATLAVVANATLEPRIPTLVYVFADESEFGRFRPRPDLGGFMVQRTHRNLLAVDASEPELARAVVFHEYVHFLLRNGGAVHYPAWYDEGFAEFFSTVAVEEDDVLIGLPPAARAQWLLYGSLLDLRRIMTENDVGRLGSRARSRFYAQAWALTHFFYLSHRLGYPHRYEPLTLYLRLLNQGSDPDEACRRAFGATFAELEGDFLRYVGEGKMPYLRRPLAELEVAEGFAARPLPEPEKALLLGDLAFALGEEWQGEAELWFRRAVEVAPQNARAHAALAAALARAGGEKAEPHLERALELAPDDPEVHRLRAEARLDAAVAATDPETAAARVAEAQRHFRRSIELDPSQVAAYAGLGRSHLQLPDDDSPEEGLEALRTAHARLPAERAIGLWLAELEMRTGAVDSAQQRLVRLPERPHGDPAAAGERSAIESARHSAGLPPQGAGSARVVEGALLVRTPSPGERVRAVSNLVEVAGLGGFWESTFHDVVLALDESSSTLMPTGADLDGDGRTGATSLRGYSSRLRDYSTDPGDAIVVAELEAARALIRQLDPLTTRVGVVAFSGHARLLAPLGPPAAALEALDDYRIRLDPSGTSLALALGASLDQMLEARDLERRRQRSIVLLSDGQPTVPTEHHGKVAALELADRLGEFGIPVHAFALGEIALEEPEFYRELAERSEGRFVPVESLADVVSHVADVRLTGLEGIEMRNLRNGASGRAVRVLPDGSFDGFVPLEPGENEIEIVAELEDAAPVRERRTVFFERPDRPGPRDLEAARARSEELERRSLELDLLGEMRQRRRSTQERELEVEPEPGADGPEP